MVSIKRGAKLSGQAGEVIAVNGKSVVLKLADGTFTVQNETNIKVPDEPVLTLTELAAVVQNEINGAPNTEALLRLVDALEDRLPGFRSRITV